MRKVLIYVLMATCLGGGLNSVIAQELEEKPMGLTYIQFLDKYNNFAKQTQAAGLGISFKNLDVGEWGETETAKSTVTCSTKNTCVMLYADKKTDQLLSVTLIATGDGTSNSGVAALTHFYIGSAAADPTANTMKDNVKVVNQLIQSGSPKSKVIQNDFRFSFEKSDILGNWLTIRKD